MERTKPREIKVDLTKIAGILSADVAGLERYFGYDGSVRQGKAPIDIADVDPVCIVSNVVLANYDALRQKTQLNFHIGDWFVSWVGPRNTTTYGPFKTADKVFGFARSKLPALRFIKQDDSEGLH
jgi:hypothetical protein